MMQMDGSRIHIDPHFARTSFKDGVSLFEAHAESNSLEAKLICGSSCLEKDRVEFGDANFKCAVGDRIVFNKAGAYTYGMSPLLFIQPSPDVWLKKTNGDIMLVHKKMLFEEIGHLMEGKN
jgi:diaminopimelate decarboxylase